MPTTYPLDLTGASPANLITNEVHTFTTANDRIFPLSAGPFYTTGLAVYHGVTNVLLAPVTQYKALQMHRAGSLVSGKEVCAIIIVEDPSVPAVRVEYQCIGGIYSSEATLIRDLIDNNPLPEGPTIWGQIVGVPVQFPPTEHLHHVDNLYGAEEIVAVLERLRMAIAAGDSPSIAAIYQHVHVLLANSNYITEQQVIDLINSTNVPWQLKANINGDPTQVFNLKSDPIVGVLPTEGINAAYLAVQFAALWQRLTVNGIDADLAATNNATGLDLDGLQFRVPGEWYFAHAINAVKLNTPGILIVRKAGNKVYQHIILESGHEGNRYFNGIAWTPWSVSAGSGVTSIPVSGYGDLNTYVATGFFNFKTSDNLGHAPPSQGVESDFTLQVIATPGSVTVVIQIANNITTNTSYARHLLFHYDALYPDNISDWIVTAHIDYIINNTNIDNIVGEGTYLIDSVTNTGLPGGYSSIVRDYGVLRVKPSATTQSIVQVLQSVHSVSVDYVSPTYVEFRTMISDGVSAPEYGNWISEMGRMFNTSYTTGTPHYESYMDARFFNAYSTTTPYLGITRESYVNSALSNYDLNALRHTLDDPDYEPTTGDTITTRQRGYYFTLSDNILNFPPALNDPDYFFILLTGTWIAFSDVPIGTAPANHYGRWIVQIIYQLYYETPMATLSTATSAVYIRVASEADWTAGIIPDWDLLQ